MMLAKLVSSPIDADSMVSVVYHVLQLDVKPRVYPFWSYRMFLCAFEIYVHTCMANMFVLFLFTHCFSLLSPSLICLTCDRNFIFWTTSTSEKKWR